MDELNIQDLLNEIEEIIKFVIRKINLDNSSFARNIKINFIDNQLTIDMPDYAIYIDRGRKPNGRMPPIKSIIDFIRSRNITSTDLTEEQLAYAIANSIKRTGIESRPFIDELTKQVSMLVSEHVYNEINKLLSKLTTNN